MSVPGSYEVLAVDFTLDHGRLYSMSNLINMNVQRISVASRVPLLSSLPCRRNGQLSLDIGEEANNVNRCENGGIIRVLGLVAVETGTVNVGT